MQLHVLRLIFSPILDEIFAIKFIGLTKQDDDRNNLLVIYIYDNHCHKNCHHFSRNLITFLSFLCQLKSNSKILKLCKVRKYWYKNGLLKQVWQYFFKSVSDQMLLHFFILALWKQTRSFQTLAKLLIMKELTSYNVLTVTLTMKVKSVMAGE